LTKKIKAMPKKNSPLKKARKTLKFWYKVLLSSNLMNEQNDRIDFQEALDTIKQHEKKQSGT